MFHWLTDHSSDERERERERGGGGERERERERGFEKQSFLLPIADILIEVGFSLSVCLSFFPLFSFIPSSSSLQFFVVVLFGISEEKRGHDYCNLYTAHSSRRLVRLVRLDAVHRSMRHRETEPSSPLRLPLPCWGAGL